MTLVAGLSSTLECLSARLPSLRDALLALPLGEVDVIEFEEGQVLLHKGETATALYVVVSGRLAATAPREDGSVLTLSELGAGDIVGEMAILAGGGVYSATVSVLQRSTVVKVPRETFERIAASSPAVVYEMADGIRRRLARDQLAIGLPRLFGSLDETMLQFVESRVEWIQLSAGQRLFSAGDKGEELYFVLGGRLRALSADGVVLSEMARGESIGEIAILTGEPRTATVVAVRDSELVRVSRKAFDEIVEKYPQVMHTIARIVVRRLRAKEQSRLDEGSAECIAVLPAGSGAPAVGFTGYLVRALESIGPTLHLSARHVDQLLNRPGIAEAGDADVAGIRLATWLDEQESKYRFLVYEANASGSAWTQRCLRQADEIVLVADASCDCTPSAAENSLLGPDGSISQARRTLVLLHKDGGQLPSGTARWFVGRNISRHFHVRLDVVGDFQRLARCLAGAAIGLVLGGGGARGLAHIGVIRALREANVPIDMTGGTSMGSVIASLTAMGRDWEQMLEINREAWLRRKPHKEYGPPIISLVRSRRLDRMAQELWGDIGIEDLWLSFFCVSCNLSTSEMLVHERGPLWKAIRASASLPGVFVPVLEQGNVLVDGGIVNNLPGDIMRKRSCRRLLVVDVGSEKDFTFAFSEIPSPWQFLRSRLLPFGRPVEVPHIAHVLIRTTDVSSSQKAKEVRKDADVYLRPPIDAFGMLQFEALNEIAEAGYRYAKDTLSRLKDNPAFQDLFS